MIHELRIYTLKPGKVPEFLKLAEERALPIRGDNYGKMEGYWFSEFGALNQIFHLWSYEDLNTRQKLRGELTSKPEWKADYASQVQPLIRRQEVRFMHPRLPLKPPAESGNIYEYRCYQTAIGKAPGFIEAITEAMPVREKYSQNVCLWHSEAERPNEVSHLWVYKDLETRAKARAAATQDPDWRTMLGKGGSMLEEMHSTILMPASFSPLR
tara:strand:- start:95 stop:730 length:636 start_codon:yes stop_codon:yes gene_type:complete